MKEINVSGKKREDLGKKASKQLRKEGYVPCNIYGAAQADGKPVALAFAAPMSELRKVVYTPHIYVINLNIDGEDHTAILKELQFHPVTDALLHVDFYAVNDQKPITIGIPVKLVGLAQGVTLTLRTAPYQRIPEHLDIDVTNLKIGKSIKVGQLKFEGLEMATPKDVVVCSVKMTRAANLSAVADTADEGDAAAEGEGEAAPAEA